MSASVPAPGSMPEASLRLVPILLVSSPMVAAQGRYSQDPLAVPLGVLMCALFVFLAPLSWRVLFPEPLPVKFPS